MTLSVLSGIFTPSETSHLTIGPEKFSAANALPRKPASVIATCIVARKRAGSFVSLYKRIARLSPSSAIFSSLGSFMLITAISADAKTAFSAIRIT